MVIVIWIDERKEGKIGIFNHQGTKTLSFTKSHFVIKDNYTIQVLIRLNLRSRDIRK